MPDIAAPALPRSGHFILPNSAHTSANSFIAAPIRTSDNAELNIFLGCIFFINDWKPANARSIPVIPETPFANPSQLSLDRSSQTEARILSAAAMITICMAPFFIFLLLFDMTLAAPTNMVIKPRTPVSPIVN